MGSSHGQEMARATKKVSPELIAVIKHLLSYMKAEQVPIEDDATK